MITGLGTVYMDYDYCMENCMSSPQDQTITVPQDVACHEGCMKSIRPKTILRDTPIYVWLAIGGLGLLLLLRS